MVKRESNKFIGVPHGKDVIEGIIDGWFNRHQKTKSDIYPKHL